MRHFKMLLGILLVPLFFIGCEDEFTGSQNQTDQTVIVDHQFKDHHLIDYCCKVENDLMADQDLDVGTVIIGNDETTLYVTFLTVGDWWMTNTKVWVGEDDGDIPVTKKGNPIRGKFTEDTDHDPFVQSFTYTFDLPLDWECGDEWYVAAHADVVTFDVIDDVIEITREETAWGTGIFEFEGNAWGWYDMVTLKSCCPDHVFVLRDVVPWEEIDIQDMVLDALGVDYDFVGTADLGELDLDPCHDLVIITGDQNQAFYDALAGQEGLIYDFVSDGGKLIWEASDHGWNGGNLNLAGVVLPAGVSYLFSPSSINYVVSGLPPVDGMPSPMSGSQASHGFFLDLVPGTVIHLMDNRENPTMIEFVMGCGKVLMATQPMEFNYFYNPDMEDLILRVYAYMTCLPVPDLPGIDGVDAEGFETILSTKGE